MAEKVTITVRASTAHHGILTVQDAMQQVLDLFNALSPSDDEQSQIAWRLSYASTNSPFTAQGEAVSLVSDVDVTVIAKTLKSDFVKKLSAIGRGDIEEEYKSGKQAGFFRSMFKRNLNGVGVTEIRLFDDVAPIQLTPKYAATAVANLETAQVFSTQPLLRFGRAREERGSLEGYFLDVGSHYGQPAIRIIERKSKTVFWCRVDEELRDKIASEADYNDVWNRQRIRVKGSIRYDTAGRITHVVAHNFEMVKGGRTELRSLFDSEFTGELSTGQYLELLREGNLAEQA